MNHNIVTNEMKSGIYQIRNIKKGKVYVGQTNNLMHRRSQHFRSLLDDIHYNRYLQRAFNKYGEESFVFEILECCSVEKLNERERYWIENKESEYADKGYNAAYAVSLFNKYDNNRKINKTKRKAPKPVEYTDEIRVKFQQSISKYWENEENHIRHSLSTSKIDYETIVGIKTLLREDLEIELTEIAKRFNVSPISVTHIRNLASHKYILQEYNYTIKNRYKIIEKRKNRIAIRMYREGYSYQEIGNVINAHHRNVITRINNIKNKHDDRCRLNTINRASLKKTTLVRTLSKMGNSDVKMSKMLKASRSNIYAIRRGTLLKGFDNVNQTRSKVKPFRYKCTEVS